MDGDAFLLVLMTGVGFKKGATAWLWVFSSSQRFLSTRP